jgi:hypothetical protein
MDGVSSNATSLFLASHHTYNDPEHENFEFDEIKLDLLPFVTRVAFSPITYLSLSPKLYIISRNFHIYMITSFLRKL